MLALLAAVTVFGEAKHSEDRLRFNASDNSLDFQSPEQSFSLSINMVSNKLRLFLQKKDQPPAQLLLHLDRIQHRAHAAQWPCLGSTPQDPIGELELRHTLQASSAKIFLRSCKEVLIDETLSGEINVGEISEENEQEHAELHAVKQAITEVLMLTLEKQGITLSFREKITIRSELIKMLPTI